MDILKDGSFSFKIPAAELSRGLRPSRHSPRNTKFLAESNGAIGIDGVLQSISDLNEALVDTGAITDGFPYPQIFVFTNMTVVCGETDIYELVAGALVHQLNVAAGFTWYAVDFYNFLYLSNGRVAVIRDLGGTYAITTDLPIASGICNFNGQVMIGSPDAPWI